MAAFLAARDFVGEVEAATAGASVDEEEAWLPRHDAACARMEAALDAAMGLPAPDLAAFAAKLELLFKYGIEPEAVEAEWEAAIRADAKRLQAGAV